MSRNLRDKIRLLVQDAYDLRQESVITKIENLVKEELDLQQEDRELEYNDIVFIQAAASQNFTKTRIHTDSLGRLATDESLVRTLALVNAVVSFLRERKLLHTLFSYKK